MKNFLNILIIVLLTVIFFNLFSPWQAKKEWLDISFSAREYSIPATVSVKVSNYTDKKETLNTCNDIKIRKNWTALTFPQEFCKDLEIAPQTVSEVNYQKYYEIFKQTWKYSLEASLSWDRKFTSDTSIVNKWAISKIFVSLVYAPIYNLFIWLVNIFSGSFWWAIIFVTIIIRLILVWPQHKSMISQRKLQEIQPKINKIKEENKWNQQAIWMKVWELYKKEKINPFGSCGILFIQIPIILVLYNVILSVKDYSNTFYLYSFLENFDISKIDFNFYWLDLFQTWWTQWIILAVVVWLIQFIQIKLSFSFTKKDDSDKKWVVLEKKSWDDKYSQMMPDTELMNKFMLYVVPLMIWFATYSLFSWVGVYWWISTLFMLIQQIIVNKIMKKSS